MIFDLDKILNLVKLVFLYLDKMTFELLLTILLILVIIDIGVDILTDLIFFSIKINEVAILLKS